MNGRRARERHRLELANLPGAQRGWDQASDRPTLTGRPAQWLAVWEQTPDALAAPGKVGPALMRRVVDALAGYLDYRNRSTVDLDTLAAAAGCSRRAVQYALGHLEACGLLHRRQRWARKPGAWRSTVTFALGEGVYRHATARKTARRRAQERQARRWAHWEAHQPKRAALARFHQLTGVRRAQRALSHAPRLHPTPKGGIGGSTASGPRSARASGAESVTRVEGAADSLQLIPNCGHRDRPVVWSRGECHWCAECAPPDQAPAAPATMGVGGG